METNTIHKKQDSNEGGREDTPTQNTFGAFMHATQCLNFVHLKIK
jgi:hypothetical protein